MRKGVLPFILLGVGALMLWVAWPVLVLVGNTILGRVELRITPLPGCFVDDITVNGKSYKRRTVVTYVPRGKLTVSVSRPSAVGKEFIVGEMYISKDKDEMYMKIGCNPLRFVDDKEIKAIKP